MKKVFFVMLLGVLFSGVASANSKYKSSAEILSEQWNTYYNKLRYCDRLPYYQASMCRLSAMHSKPSE
ncbi:hypothetical protein [Campylobacter helveticus]|uniref:hypothetical protein n=2 Tax=Campylobacter helveticus TaxID=28898 RepID=UPI001112AB7A|nr:hypothetical protein [Campylobacter helveticus]MCR2062598.1 hypothetical protein [Campylobacter helveticus]TNB62292.1 hypothetical protein FDR72_00650 [Campylobacter helveticus]